MILAAGKLPKVTVIIAVYNAASALEKTLQNLRSLDYPNLALIVVDGASTDGTRAVIEKASDSLEWWVSEPDSGIYEAMNKGWAAASRDSFILSLGAGDMVISLPDDISAFAKKDVLYGDVLIGERWFHGNAGFALKFNNTLHHQALLVHKSIHVEPPFDERFKIYADFDFNQRLMQSGTNFVYSRHFKAYAQPEGVSSRKKYLEILKVVKKNFGLLFTLRAFFYLLARKISNLLALRTQAAK